MRSEAVLRNLRWAAVLVLACWITACATQPVPTYQPSVDNTERLLGSGGSKLAVGAFDAATGVENRRLSLRGNPMEAGGKEGTFSAYLQHALRTELETGGRYDSRSTLQLSGTLVRNTINVGASKGSATLSVHFVVDRSGQIVFDKMLSATQQWDSSFIGAIAVPMAVQNYAGAVQKLVGVLLADSDFQHATSEGGKSIGIR